MYWQICLYLAAIMLLPATSPDNVNDDDDDVTQSEEVTINISMMPSRRQSTTPLALPDKVQLECYSCTFNDKQQACLDPVKDRMKATKCPGVDDKCFTMLRMKRNQTISPRANLILNRDDVADIVRGCMRNCSNSEAVICCDLNRCNYNPFVVKARRTMSQSHETARPCKMLFIITAVLVTSFII